MKIYRDQRSGGSGVFAEQESVAASNLQFVFASQRSGASAVFSDQILRPFGGTLRAIDVVQTNRSAAGVMALAAFQNRALGGKPTWQANVAGGGSITRAPAVLGTGSAQRNRSGVGDVARLLDSIGQTTHQRLISYVHAAVFDKAPIDLTAFRVRHPKLARWTIAEGVMLVRTGGTTFSFALANRTVGQLASALTARGFVVSDLDPDVARLSSLVLVEGSGDETVSNGDRVAAYTSLLWAVMGAYSGVVRDASLQVVQALRQMVITQAEGEWLDLWGNLYNAARRQGEIDSAYAPRIPKEAFRLRESPLAIEEAVKDATGKTIRIEEPWEGIFRLDHSVLSGPDKFQDGHRVGYFYIQPVSETPINWSDVLPVIERNKAAGVVVLPPFARNRAYVDAGLDPVVYFDAQRHHIREQKYEDRTLLDYSRIEDVPVLNYPAVHRKEVRHGGYLVVSGWPDVPWEPVPWNDSPYSSIGYRYRSYREYRRLTVYETQYWYDEAWPNVKWQDYDVVIGSFHYSYAPDGLHTLVNEILPSEGYW